MKTFTRMAAAGIAGALILAATGCANNNSGDQTSATKSETTAEITTEATTEVPSESTDATAAAHKVEVEEVVLDTKKDANGNEYKTIVPKITIDGKEASELNASISSVIQKNYGLEENGEYVDGYQTKFVWAVKDNIISIIFDADYLTEDGGDTVAFNYNIETLAAVSNADVIKAYGLSEDDFKKKVADAYTGYWDNTEWLKNEDKANLKKSIDEISLTTVTPCVLPNGELGVIGRIYLPAGSQFEDINVVFDLKDLKAASLFS